MAKKIDMESVKSVGNILAVLSDIVWSGLVQLKGKAYTDVALTSFKVSYEDKGCAVTWGIRVDTFYGDWVRIKEAIKGLFSENLKSYYVTKVTVLKAYNTFQYVDYNVVFNLNVH